MRCERSMSRARGAEDADGVAEAEALRGMVTFFVEAKPT